MQFFNLLRELNDLAVVLLYVVSSKAVRHGGGTGENRGRSEASNNGEIKTRCFGLYCRADRVRGSRVVLNISARKGWRGGGDTE